MARRAEKKEETRRRLRQQAFLLFARRGYDATRIEDIAHAAGVSPRTVYRYFPTKSELVYADTEANVATVAELIASRPKAERPFAALCAALVDFVPELDSRENFERGKLIATDPTLYRYSLEVRDRMGEGMGRALVARGGPGGSEADRLLLGQLAMAALLVALREWRDAGPKREPLAAYTSRVLGAIPRLARMSG